MARKFEQKTLYLEADQYRRLLELKRRTNIPYATLVREAVDLYLPRKEAETDAAECAVAKARGTA